MNKSQYILKLVPSGDRQVLNTIQLLEEGATIPFIARYRKERTGGLDEVQIQKIADAAQTYDDLIKRQQTILKAIDEQGKLSEQLKEQIESTYDANVLEDLYLPYKKKRQTKAEQARKDRLEPLAKIIMSQREEDLFWKANSFISTNRPEPEDALEGARYIIAEWISENARLKESIRTRFKKYAKIHSKLVKGKELEDDKFRDYYDYNEPAYKAAPHRVLAVFRAEKEGVLNVKVQPDAEPLINQVEKYYIKSNGQCAEQLAKACKDAYKRLIAPSLETEYRQEIKLKADAESIKVFGANLRQLLMQSPLGSKRIMAIDPGFRTGCKVVCLDNKGDIKNNITIYPHAPQNQQKEAKKKLSTLAEQYKIEAIAIGNGTASRETERLVKGTQFRNPINIFIVNEAGASIYSASKIAREEFPNYDVTVRGSISIGRRLMDPLAELVKIEPKSIGVGQYQHDVDQKLLSKRLDETTVSCVNKVGVNLNTASKHLLQYVSGIGPKLAETITTFRKEKGMFSSRKELKEVKGMGAKAFEQCAGFLRIPKADNPLDNTAIHPERYKLVNEMAKTVGCNVEELLNEERYRLAIDKNAFVSEEIGLPTIEDIIHELEKPGLDPRKLTRVLEFSDKIKNIDDLSIGMELVGLVNNITNFGAFVDIGIKENGLVHKSQINDSFVENPIDVLSIQQHVRVKIIEIDVARKRIALSMKGLEQPKMY